MSVSACAMLPPKLFVGIRSPTMRAAGPGCTRYFGVECDVGSRPTNHELS